MTTLGTTSIEPEDRLLNAAEREMVALTRSPDLAEMSKEDLQALGKRLRQARDRYRRIASRQQREMRGKADPHGATPARDNTGSVNKVEVLVEALKRVTQALRRLNAPTQAQLARKALEAKRAAPAAQHPGAERTASKGMRSKASDQPTVRVDPREVGRVSKAGKVAQARRDR